MVARARARAKLRNSDGNFAVWRQLRVSACVNTLLRRPCCEKQCETPAYTRTFIAILSCPFDYASAVHLIVHDSLYRCALRAVRVPRAAFSPPLDVHYPLGVANLSLRLEKKKRSLRAMETYKKRRIEAHRIFIADTHIQNILRYYRMSRNYS